MSNPLLSTATQASTSTTLHAVTFGAIGTVGALLTAWVSTSGARLDTPLTLSEFLLSPTPGVAALTGIALAAWSYHCHRRVRTAEPTRAGSEDAAAVNIPLLAEVIPVWHTQLEMARSHADESANSLLEAFSEIDSKLDRAIQMTHQAQSSLHGQGVDDLMQDNEEALATLLAPMRQAMDHRDEVMTALEAVTDELTALREVAQQVKQLARRTNMVALNASVEASRGGERGSGFATVAQEVRQLAQQSADAGTRMLSLTSKLESSLNELRTRTIIQDTSNEALTAEANASARAAIGGLLRNLGDINRSTRGLHEAGQAVREQVERTLMGFQSQDRLNQMMSIILADIERMQEWIKQGGDLSHTEAMNWLERLEGSYTMDEQRTLHHGQSAVERSSGVDFF